MNFYIRTFLVAPDHPMTSQVLLLFREESQPKIQNSDCDDCPLCRSRSSNLKDSCSNINTLHGDSFYAMVVAHKDYREAKVTFSALNLKSVNETEAN